MQEAHISRILAAWRKNQPIKSTKLTAITASKLIASSHIQTLIFLHYVIWGLERSINVTVFSMLINTVLYCSIMIRFLVASEI